jgi:hypothetical protein
MAMIGVLIGLFALVGPYTPTWVIGAQAFAYGFFSSFQYTSMNTLTYADIATDEASKASRLASTAQQMSLSFGVAAASLVAAVFVPVALRGDAGRSFMGFTTRSWYWAWLRWRRRGCFGGSRRGMGRA